MFSNKLLNKALALTGSTLLSTTLLVSLVGTFSINTSAQTASDDRDYQYKKLSEILAKKGSVSVLTTLSVDEKQNQATLESYARNYAKNFPEFIEGKTDGSEKRDLPPVYESLIKPFTEELRKNELAIAKTSFYSPDVAVNIKSQGELKRLFSSRLAQHFEENETNTIALSNSNPVIKSRDSWDSGVNGGGKNKIVAILDTGVQNNHPFLSGKVTIEACFSTTGTNVVSNCPGGSDTQYGAGSAAPCNYSSSCSHGTHVAGIAAGKSSNLASDFHGVARDAKIMAVQVFSRFNSQSSCGSTPAPCVRSYTQDQKEGLNYVALGALIQAIFNSTQRIASANMSIGGGTPTTSYCDTDSRKASVDTLKSLKVATAIAAGNDGQFGLSTPGCISSAITVGATDNTDVVASFSNRHPNVDLFAPGVSIYSSVPTSTYGYKSGTSMATPMVAGAMAILAARLPSNSVDENLKVLQDTGVNVNYVNSGTTYTEKRLKFCKSYLKIGTTWYCNFLIYPFPIKINQKLLQKQI